LSPIEGFIAKNEIVKVDENLKPDNVTIYPNPVLHGQMLNVNLEGASQEGFNLAVFDVTGKVLLQQHYSQQQKFVVDVSAFPSGAYILTIRNSKMNFSNKFIVN
jgi:hypothetical protein